MDVIFYYPYLLNVLVSFHMRLRKRGRFFSYEIKKEEAEGSPLLVDHTSTRERTVPMSKGGDNIGVTK